MPAATSPPAGLALAQAEEHQAQAPARASAGSRQRRNCAEPRSCHWTRATVLTVMAVAYGLVAVSIVKSGTMPGWLRSRSNMLVLAQARLTELRLGRNSSAGEAIAVALRSMDRAVHQVDAVMYSSLAVAALLFILTFASSLALTPTLRGR